ncbi:DUF4136 domain-containing protein [Spirosoma sp. KCTC 42546]|uniref:DUF4136 domain-containing protein n=1 Tax=Spirosoma sp. KCTC 42546 TaxID=2520506 RepID=UPI0011582BD3|nr:DUF4136 domain-containing protein [Spirosoma sp. KCTC 42546]QDK78170.1 DUF4136 domain-containing protein [Spirosoma sp. KCTC 42546]
MKRLFLGAALMLAASLTQAQNVTIDSEIRPNTDFSHFKSYAWATQPDTKQEYARNSPVIKKQIRDAIGNAMDGRGYTLARQSPDLIVNVRVFDQPTTIKGYTGSDTDNVTPGAVQSLGKEKDINIQAGTILVNLVDTQTDQSVWQGLASGLTSTNGLDRQEGKIREAVNLIFNQYPYRADKF